MSAGALARAVTVEEAAAVAAKVQQCSGSFSAVMMAAVDFTPQAITQHPDGSLGFLWTAQKRALNGFKSVHGGALSTLADAFTKIHTKAAFPDKAVASQSFEISFLTALFEKKQCVCVTKLLSSSDNVVFTDFSFQDGQSGEVYARGTHVLTIA